MKVASADDQVVLLTGQEHHARLDAGRRESATLAAACKLSTPPRKRQQKSALHADTSHVRLRLPWTAHKFVANKSVHTQWIAYCMPEPDPYNHCASLYLSPDIVNIFYRMQ